MLTLDGVEDAGCGEGARQVWVIGAGGLCVVIDHPILLRAYVPDAEDAGGYFFGLGCHVVSPVGEVL